MGAKSLMEEGWLALAIGNSRLHWGRFLGKILQATWDTPHLTSPLVSFLPPSSEELWIASVVPEQTHLWQNFSTIRLITLADIPLTGLYPTLGIDRALSLWGAGSLYGWPALVIDGGTSLTFSSANRQAKFMGGAILPGLKLQLRSLAVKTSQLPEVQLPDELPDRWAANTSEAIQSGVIHTALAGICAFITDWQQHNPGGTIVFTGGDGSRLLQYLQSYNPELAKTLRDDPHLIFQGIQQIRQNQ